MPFQRRNFRLGDERAEGDHFDWALGRGRWELAASWILLALTLGLFIRFSRDTLTASLWNDEIYSILNYSGEGPLVTVSTYTAPNNHIFFNLLNSVFPYRTSMEPLRARFLSHVAVFMLSAGLLWFFAKREAFPLGVLALQASIANYEFLDLSLQARGYGLAALLCFVTTVFFIRARDEPSTKSLLGFGLANAFGIFTLPTFAFWSVPLFSILLFRHKRVRVVIWCAASMALTLLLHAGVMSEMMGQLSGGYSKRWGFEFTHVSAVYESLRLYVFGNPHKVEDWLVTAFLLAGIVSVAVSVKGYHSFRAEHDLLFAVGLFFCICLFLKTPLIRTTSFVAVPITISLCLCLGTILQLIRPRELGRVLLLALLLVFIVRDVRKLQMFCFVPIENWKQTAALISKIFPEGMPVAVTTAAPYLSGYLRNHPVLSDLEESRVRSGEIVVAETPMIPEMRRPLSFKDLRQTASLLVPQRREGFQTIHFHPPQDSLVEHVQGEMAHEVTDRDFSTCFPVGGAGEVRIALRAGVPIRSVVVRLRGPDLSLERFDTRASFLVHGTEAPPQWLEQQGNTLVAGAGDRPMDEFLLRIPKAAPGTEVCEVWAYRVKTPKLAPGR